MGENWPEIIDPHAFDAALPADVPLTLGQPGPLIGRAHVTSVTTDCGGVMFTARLDPKAGELAAILDGASGPLSFRFVLDDDTDLIARMTRPV